MPLICHVDGKQVHLNDDLEATITAAGGYEQLTATCSRDDVAHAHQGSHISLETQAKHEVWFGTLDATPALSRFPVAKILASGPIGKANKQRGNRLYQSRDYSLWDDASGDPYNYHADEGYRVSADNALKFVAPDGQPFATGDRCGQAFWAHGEPVSRVAFTINKNRDTSEFELRLYGATGPSGTRTLLTTWALDATNPGGTAIDYTITGDYDLITLEMAAIAGDFTILTSAARTTNGTGAWQALPGAAQRWPVAARATMNWTAHSGTTETLAVDIETAGDAATPQNRGSFDQKGHGAAASGTDDTNLEGLGSSLRAKWTIGGAGSPSWTFNVTADLGYRKFALTLLNVRVNGRTLGDDFSPGQIIEDMSGYLGWATQGVQSSGTNALPWYWEGGSWGDAFAELANLDDWPFLVTRNAINYSPWGERWDLRFSQEHEDLDFPPIYNSVRVFYTTQAGSSRSVKLQASPDPLARFDEDNEYQYDLSQSYDGDTIPKAVAAALLERVSEQRVIGTVRVEKLDTNKRVWTPRKRFTVGSSERIYHIQPGDLARLEPYPKLPPQRIVGVRLHANDVELEFGEDIEQVSASRTLARIAGRRARQRRKLRTGK